MNEAVQLGQYHAQINLTQLPAGPRFACNWVLWQSSLPRIAK